MSRAFCRVDDEKPGLPVSQRCLPHLRFILSMMRMTLSNGLTAAGGGRDMRVAVLEEFPERETFATMVG